MHALRLAAAPGDPVSADVTWVQLFWSEGHAASRGWRVLVAGEVVAVVFLGDVLVPVGVEVAAGGDGAEPEDGLGACRPQRAPVMPIRSATRWRQAPSMTPVAMGQPFARARG